MPTPRFLASAAGAVLAALGSAFGGYSMSAEAAIMEMEVLSQAIEDAKATGLPVRRSSWSHHHFSVTGGARSHHTWKKARARGHHDFRRTVHAS